MQLSRKKSSLVAGLALLLLLALIAAPATPARAASEDVAMFYDALSSYGNWVDYGNYGPVWYPTQGVTQNWRPYVDGRWVPTDDGWVFETGEPWGWATYHWGNWMPTSEYGWVWSPGSTWYPSTAAWRTNDDYVGWAPIPPADYVPEPAYAPAGGYYPEEQGYAPTGGILSRRAGNGPLDRPFLDLRPGGQLSAGLQPALSAGLLLLQHRLPGAVRLCAFFIRQYPVPE